VGNSVQGKMWLREGCEGTTRQQRHHLRTTRTDVDIDWPNLSEDLIVAEFHSHQGIHLPRHTYMI
jgi:hypothetical protein